MFRLKSILCLFCFCMLVCETELSGQQNGHYSQYMMNKYQNNPAFGGLEKSLSVHIANRSQWSKLTRNPSQQYISAHMPIYLINGGVGIKIENDRIGVERTTSLEFSYNYVSKTSIGLISAGGSFGMINKSLDGNAIITPDGVYEGGIFTHNDPELSESYINGNTAIWNVGIYYVQKRIEAGFSILNLPSHSINIDETNISLSPRYLFFIESNFKPWAYPLILKPSLIIMRDQSEIQASVSCIGEFGNILAGIGLRGYSNHSIDGLNVIMGMQLSEHLRMTYSYDYGLNSLQSVSEGSHELGINYNLRKLISWGLPPKVTYNPRNL